MAGELISGPAGGGKSAAGRKALAARMSPAVLIDFQTIYAGLLGIERSPTGRYPERQPEHGYALPIAEYTRRAQITAARNREFYIVATNSDGDAQRRAELLALLGPGSTETVLDPGRAIVVERLSVEGRLSIQCESAIDRWYGRL